MNARVELAVRTDGAKRSRRLQYERHIRSQTAKRRKILVAARAKYLTDIYDQLRGLSGRRGGDSGFDKLRKGRG